MADVQYEVKGLKELGEFLESFPDKLQRSILRAAFRDGAKPIKDEAYMNCPVGEPSSENVEKYGGYAGALRDSIRVRVGIKGTQVVARIIVGGRTKYGATVWYAHLIEFTGAREHAIEAPPGSSLAFLGIFTRFVRHPGMEAKPFLRPAGDHKAAAALIATAEGIRKRLSKQGLEVNTPVSVEEIE